MKGGDPFKKTKVVIRRLPPAISQEELTEKIDGAFSGRYNWMCFRPGKNSQKNQHYAHAYIDLKNAEDVVEFAEFFDGHVFVNEKGTQFKASVEFAPSQRVPMFHKKDGREGTIHKDLDYMKFLEILEKPVENLPSAEVQLEKKEAELAGGAKYAPIVTPLMDFVRQKRAAKTVSQRSSTNGKFGQRTRVASGSGSISASSKRGSEKQKGPTSVYVLRDGANNSSRKEKSEVILASRWDDQQLLDKTAGQVGSGRMKAPEDKTGMRINGAVSGVSRVSQAGKQRVNLLKARERETYVPVTSSGSSSFGLPTFKQSSHHEVGRVIVRSILSKDASQAEQKIQTQHVENNRHPLRSTHLVSRNHSTVISDQDKISLDDKLAVNDLRYSTSSEKQDKRTRNKDKPDRGHWAPLHRSDGSHACEYSPFSSSSSSSIKAQVSSESSKSSYIFRKGNNKIRDDDSGIQCFHSKHTSSSTFSQKSPSNHSDMKADATGIMRRGVARIIDFAENGSHRHGGRRVHIHRIKEVDQIVNLSQGKHYKKTVAGYGSHEKQVWVQKTVSG